MTNQQRWWPTTPYDFVDVGKCPACFTPLNGPVCGTCGLDLSHPRSAELLEIGKTIVGAEEGRQRVIAELRELAAAKEPATAPQAAPPAPVHVAPEAPAAASVPTPSQAAEPKKRRLTVPTLLIIVGVFLASVAAIGLAWFYSNLIVRAGIIAAFTIATILAATQLRKRSLTMSAEGVAVLGIVLLGLDAWAVHANNLFGTGEADPLLYAAIATIVVGVICRVWAVFSGLRAPDYAAVVALPAGIGVLIAAIGDFDSMGAITIGLFGASLGTLIHLLPAPYSVANEDAVTHRTTLAAIGVGALAAGALCGVWAIPDAPWAPAWITAIVLLLTAVHVWALQRSKAIASDDLLIAIAATTATLSVGTIGWQLAARFDADFYSLFLGPVMAVAVFVALTHIRVFERLTDTVRVPLYAAAVLTATSLLAAFTLWAGKGVGAGWRMWRTDPFVASDPQTAITIAAAALTIAALLFVARAGLLWNGMLRAAIIAVVLMFGAYGTGVPAATIFAAALIACGAVWLIRRESGRTPTAITWTVVSALAAITAFFVGMAHPGLWLGAVVLAGALPLALAWALPAEGRALSAFAVAPVVVLAVAATFAPSALSVLLGLPSSGMLTSILLLQWLAVATLAASLLLPRVSAALQIAGIALAAIGLVPLLFAMLGGYLSDVRFTVLTEIDTPWLSGLRAAGTLVLLLVIIYRRGVARPYLAASLVAPVAASVGVVAASYVMTSHGATTLVDGATWSHLRDEHIGIIIVAIAALVAIDGMGISRRKSTASRTASDIGALVVALLAVANTTSAARWLGLALLAFALGAMSASRGWRNPAPDASKRRYLLWAAASAGGAAWLNGMYEHVGDASVELIFLPIAALFLAMCVAMVWLRRMPEAALAAVLSITSGLSFLAAGHWYERDLLPLVLIALVAAAITAALHWAPTRSLPSVATAGAIASLVAMLIAILGMRMEDIENSPWWLLSFVAVTYAAGVGAGWREGGRMTFAKIAPPVALMIASFTVALNDYNIPLMTGIMIVLVAIHLASTYFNRSPFAATSRYVSLGLGILFSLFAFGSPNVEPIEVFTVPMAAGLIGAGLITLHRQPEARSWRTLGVGLVLLTLPSLLFDFGENELWRVIALGLVAVGLIVWGATRKLQAPLVVGSIVIAIHGIAQLWPWIRDLYEATEWWLWAGIAGVVLILLAIRYEKQKIAMRKAFVAIKSLR